MIEIDGWVIAVILAKVALYASCLLAAGSLLAALFLSPSDARMAGTLRRIALCAALPGFPILVLRLLPQAGLLIDDGFAGMIDPDVLALLIQGAMGRATAVCAAGLVMLVLAVRFPPLRRTTGCIGAFFAVFSFSLIGHATHEARAVLTVLLSLHLGCIAYWLGALAPLHRLAADRRALPHCVSMAERFGKQALVLIPLLAAAGLICSSFLTGSVQNLVMSGYGRTLIGKIILAGALLGLGAINKTRLVPAMRKGDIAAARKFRTAIRWEYAVFGAIFLITAVLTTVPALPEHP